MNIDNQFWTFGIGVVEFLIAGVDATGAHIFRVHYSGIVGGSWLEWCNRLGFRAIGSGAMHSAILLSLDEQNRNVNIDHTIYNVYSAKRSAEVAPGVGPATDIAVITSSEVKFIKPEILKKLAGIREDIIKNKRVSPDTVKGLYETT